MEIKKMKKDDLVKILEENLEKLNNAESLIDSIQKK